MAISLNSEFPPIVTGFFHFPHQHDTEAYANTILPLANCTFALTAYSNACWVNQVGNSVLGGSKLSLFKYQSMSVQVIARCGGPLILKCIRQLCTARSSCEANILATNKCAKDTLAIFRRAHDIEFEDTTPETPMLNNNQGCVDWSKSTTTKFTKCISLHSNAVQESVQQFHKFIVAHINRKINPSKIFAKELKNASYFRALRD